MKEKKNNLFLWITFLTLSLTGIGVDAQDKKPRSEEMDKKAIDDASIDFKETKFLQVEKIKLPKELKVIEEQIRQNAVDVILISNTHTPIYLKRRDELTEQYKKFYSLELQIDPFPSRKDSYQVHYFYFNWTTNKFDKHLYKIISKYNVVNEIRFGIYELLFGKDYVVKNKDIIDIQNYQRIQAVRKAIAEQAIFEKKIEKLDAEAKKKSSQTEAKKKSKLKREDKEVNPKVNLEKSEMTEIQENTDQAFAQANIEDADVSMPSDVEEMPILPITNSRRREIKKALILEREKRSNPEVEKSEDIPIIQSEQQVLEPKNPENKIKHFNSLTVQAGTFVEFSKSTTEFISTYTNARFLGMGGRFTSRQDKEFPLSYDLSARIGIPIFKQQYSFPVYKEIQFDLRKNDLFTKDFSAILGLEYSSIYFVNIAEYGQGFQVFLNDFFWIRAGVGHRLIIKETPVHLDVSFYQSLFHTSNIEKAFGGGKLSVNGLITLNEKYQLDVSLQNTFLGGDVELSTQIFHALLSMKLDL